MLAAITLRKRLWQPAGQSKPHRLNLRHSQLNPGRRKTQEASARGNPKPGLPPRGDPRQTAPATMASGSIPRRMLGTTGLEVSVIGFGASPLGSVFQARLIWRNARGIQRAGTGNQIFP